MKVLIFDTETSGLPPRIQKGQRIKDFLEVWPYLMQLTYIIYDLDTMSVDKIYNKLFTVGGSKKSYTSLKNLTKICEKITKNKVLFTRKRSTSNYDIPYFITDNKFVSKIYGWKPKNNIKNIVSDTYNWMIENKLKINLIMKIKTNKDIIFLRFVTSSPI